MQFICKKTHFDINDPILLSSKTIQHLQLDCIKDTCEGSDVVFIPDIFFDVINYSIHSALCIETFITKDVWEKNLKLLEFYDYLNIDEKYIKEVACKIGEYIEHTLPDLTFVQQNILLKNYPILNYYGKYSDRYRGKDLNNISSDDKLPKYVTPYFHKNIKSYEIETYCEYGNLNMVKYLSLAENIRENDCIGYYRDQYNEAVKIASEYGHLEIVKYLVSLGVDIRADNDQVVIIASLNGHLEIVKYLVSLGANIRTNNDYAVRYASFNGHLV